MSSDDSGCPHDSRVILQTPGSGDVANLEDFYFGIPSQGDSTIGFLATYDLKYVLQVTPANDDNGEQEIHYFKAPSTIANGGAYPSWVTDEMKFKLNKSGMQYTIESETSDNPVMDVAYGYDQLGNFIIAYPPHSGDNQKFILQNEP